MQNLEKLKRDAGAAYSALYESDGAVLERLKMMGAVLAELSNVDRTLEPIGKSVRDATIQLEESAFDLSRYLDKLELDPSELDEVNDRLNTINRILSKYGDSVETTMTHRAEIGAQIAELERAGDDLASLSTSLRPLLAELKRLGTELSERRAAAARKLGPLVEQELGELGMDRARFTPTLSPAPTTLPGEDFSASPAGFDQLEFVVQTNPGQTAQPLRRIASGGELSRIMLAIKGILAQGDRISVLVFDEIDSNVGGRLGSVIGRKLRNLATHHQVLCITHLPQIASFADRQLTVRKSVSGSQTETVVRAVEGTSRIEELAEMIGGQKVTQTNRVQAKELLDSARPHEAPESISPSVQVRRRPVRK